MKALTEIDPDRILIIKPSSIGDVVHAMPVLAALRRRFADAHIAWLVSSACRPVIEGHANLDEIIPFERNRYRGLKATLRGMRELERWSRELRQQRFDLVCDLQGLLRSGLMTVATGARWRLGFANAREGATLCYTHRIPVPTIAMHAVDRYALFVQALGGEAERRDWSLPIQADDRSWAAGTLDRLPRPRIAVNVGTRWETKRWPPHKWAAVCHRLHDEFGGSCILVGAGEDRADGDMFLEHCRGAVHDLLGQTSLMQLAAVFEQCDLYLTNDSGPMHLCAAAGTPVVAVFTCTSPTRTGPYGDGHVIVQSHVWCAPSLLKKCPRLECMDEVSVAVVAEAAAARLKTLGVGARDDDSC